MPATMLWQRGRVHLGQSHMCLAVIMAKMPKEGCSRAVIEETQYVFKKPHGRVRQEQKWGVEFHGHQWVQAAMERQPAMLHQNHTARCLPCQCGTAKNLQTFWGPEGTGALPPDQCRQPTPEPMPPLPGTLPAPTGNNSTAQHSQINNLPARYVYSHPALPGAKYVTLDSYAEDSQHDADFDPDIRTDQATSTG